MSDSLTQLVTKLQALLLGDSTTFSTASCTAAIRQALLKLNLAIPQRATETQDAISEQYEYELEDTTALQVLDVLREGLDTYADINISLSFDAYFLDDRPFIRLRVAQATGQTLIIQYLKPYTINGLDGSADSTLPSLYDAALLDGAAWQACLVRAAGRIETINMNQDVSDHFQKMADQFRQVFESGLASLARRPAPRGEPSTIAWGF
jgi:hypothetical protein